MTWGMKWDFDLAQMPTDEPVLVFLAEELTRSRIHTAQKMKIANGYLTSVATIFACDAPQILAWRPMVDDPKQETET